MKKAWMSTTQRQLVKWASWFFLINAVFYIVINFSYIAFIPSFSGTLGMDTQAVVTAIGFWVFSSIGQYGLFAIMGGVVSAAFACLLPIRALVQFVAGLIGGVIMLALIMDATVYHMFHMHMESVVVRIVNAGQTMQVFGLSTFELLFVIGLAVVVFAAEWLIGWWLWRRLKRNGFKGYGLPYYITIAAALLVSYLMITLVYVRSGPTDSKANANHVLIIESELTPLYTNFYAHVLSPEHASLVMSHLEHINQGFFMQAADPNLPMNYPRHPLHCVPPHKYNVLVILLDCWRHEAFRKDATPNIYRVVHQHHFWNFTNNYSGGNCTGPGVFSLFYSLPRYYWTAATEQHKYPLILQLLKKEGYEWAVYRSASMKFPAFYKNVFAIVPHLQLTTPGDGATARDAYTAKQMVHFMHQYKAKKPFFGFLFFDKSHDYCANDTDYPAVFYPWVQECKRMFWDASTPPKPIYNRFLNAVHYDDSLAGKVFAEMTRKHLWKNTIVILTADHGENFNDHKLGIWGHANGYVAGELHVPLLIHIPGEVGHVIHHRTWHYDVMPYLMRHVFKCTNPVSDLGFGRPLMQAGGRSTLEAFSYMDYGIITPNYIYHVYPQGNIAVKTLDGKVLPNKPIDVQVMKKALKRIGEFFQ